MASRFQRERDSRNALFSSYDASQTSRSRPSSAAPGSRSSSRNAAFSTYHANNSSPYTIGSSSGGSGGGFNDSLGGQPPSGAGFSAYPGAGGGSGDGIIGGLRGSGEYGNAANGGVGVFRSATPNKKGQYSDAVIDELESQNEDHVGEMTKKVRMLKDITMAIGDEIRDSTAFAEKMNDQFEGTRNRLRGTMNRMLRMAEKTGVGWKVWLGFFAFVWLLFVYVWLF